MRTKTEWVLETNDKGKQVPRKVGLAPVMRDGIEFEFDVCGDLDQENNLVVTKSRCPQLSGQVINRPGAEMAETLKDWLSGAPEIEKPPEVDKFTLAMNSERERIGLDAFMAMLGNHGYEDFAQIPEPKRRDFYRLVAAITSQDSEAA